MCGKERKREHRVSRIRLDIDASHDLLEGGSLQAAELCGLRNVAVRLPEEIGYVLEDKPLYHSLLCFPVRLYTLTIARLPARKP